MNDRRFKSSSKCLIAIIATIVIFATPLTLRAQGTAAVVSGFITDPTGAKVPNATVSYKNVATGVSGTTTTNSDGVYRIGGLLPGTYTGTVTMQGFKTAVKSGVDLQIEAQVTLNYALDIGAASETVTVVADSNVLETFSPTVSQVIAGRQVEETPLNGRNVMNLVTLTPGVVGQGGTQGAASNNASGGALTVASAFGNYQISGGLAGEAGAYIDGAPANIEFGNIVGLILPQDAVQEFRVESSVVNPQYGRFGGGVISFATKSGGNKVHGTVYEYLRNTIFNANNFFNNYAGIERPKFNQNQFGATVGGPLKKDRLFFFADYEGYRLAQGVVNQGQRVPTAAELGFTTGGSYLDFSADPTVYNPVPALASVGGSPLPTARYTQARCGTHVNAFCVGAPINPNDAVADPTAIYMAQTLHYLPTQNVFGNPAFNFEQNGKTAAYTNAETLRLDYNLGDKHKLFGRYTRFDRNQGSAIFFPGNIGPSGFSAVTGTTSQYVLGDSYTVSPTSVLEVRLSYLRYITVVHPYNQHVNLAGFDNGDASGFWAGAAHLLTPYFPSLLVTGNATFPYQGIGQAAVQPFNVYNVSGVYTKVLGRHSLSFGADFRQGEQYVYNFPYLDGLFAFVGTSTACIPSAAPTSVTFNDAAHTVLSKVCANGPVIPASGATPIADFVSGQFAAAPVGFDTITSRSAYSHYGGVFANDTFTISNNLTITTGVRYEHPGDYTEKHDNNAVIVPGQANPLVLVNSAGYASRGDLNSHNALFSPRVGFSYAPHVGTTVRAGYSLSFIPQNSSLQVSPYNSSINQPSTFASPGFQLCAPLGLNGATANTGSLNACTTPGVTAQTGIIQPLGRAGYLASPTAFYGQNIGGRLPSGAYPYLEQWNANVQQSLGPSTIIQLAYLGARGEHLPLNTSLNINQLPDNQIVGAPATTQVLRPYPLFQSVNEFAPFIADSYYNSAQATLTKRFKSGGTLLGNYSWSKFLSNTDSYTSNVETHIEGVPQNYHNLRAERSYLSFDVPQRLVVSYVLDLPVGQGKRFLSSAGTVTNTLVSGWNAGGINLFQSGFPLAIIASTNTLSAAYGAGTPRPNYTAGCNQQAGLNYVKAAQTGASVFNNACFSLPADSGVASSYFGNQPRTSGILRTQGVDNWDFSVGKTTPIHDSVNLVFRAEAFNVTNRVQFGDPGLTYGSVTFGALSMQANLPRSFQFSLRANY